MNNPSDHELAIAMRGGDEAAGRELYRRHGPRVTAFARALAGDAFSAQDAAQQAWTALLSRTRHHIGEIEDVGAWLVIAARNAAFSSVRGENRARQRERRSRQDADCASRVELDADLRLALDALEPSERELILLKHVADLTFEQIARALGQPRSTMHSRYSAAICKLRTLLADTAQEEVFHART